MEYDPFKQVRVRLSAHRCCSHNATDRHRACTAVQAAVEVLPRSQQVQGCPHPHQCARALGAHTQERCRRRLEIDSFVFGVQPGALYYLSNAYGYDAVTTLLDHLFSEKNLKRVYLHTLEWNKRAQRCFSKSGFNPVKSVRRMSQDFILMEVLKDDWFDSAEERLAARFDNAENPAPQTATS